MMCSRALLLLLLATAWQPLRAEEAAPPGETQPPASFRRVFVPADRVEAWPRDNEKYLPVESSEFDKLVSAANSSASQPSLRAVIREATYTGHLQGDRLLVGRGTWKIDLRGDQPAFLPLDAGTSLIYRDAHWQSGAARAARIGAWGQSGAPAEQLAVEVVQSGKLEFNWQCSLRTSQEGAEATLRLPPSTSTRLILDLPDGKRPRAGGGIVLGSRPSPAASRNNPALMRWELVLNSQSDTLRITENEKSLPEPAPAVTLHEDHSYRVSQRGLEITAELNLRNTGDDFRDVVLPIAPGLQLLSASADGDELEWDTLDADSNGTTRVVIELPAPAERRPITLTLRAWQPLVTNQLWLLPKLRPDGTFWTSGNFELSVLPTLELKRLVPADCVQIGVSQTDAGAGVESAWFSGYSPDAALTVSIERRQPDTTVELGSSLTLAEPDLNGRLVTRLDVGHGSVHRLAGQIADGWNVDSVETIPPDALSEWFVDRRNDRSEIEIQLARSVDRDRGLIVIVEGRLQPAGFVERYSADTLRMVKWRGPRVAEHLLAFQAVEPFVAEPIAELRALGRSEISESERLLLDPASADGSIFDLTQTTADSALRVAVKRGQFDAEILLDATCDRQFAQLRYHLTARPSASRIDRVLVYSTHPLGDDCRWTEQSSGIAMQAETLPESDPRRIALPAGGQVWLLRLAQPTTEPIEITLTTTLPFGAQAHLPLLSLPEATNQRGRVLVEGATGAPAVTATHMRPIPLPPPRTSSDRNDVSQTVHAAYRYQPADCHDAASVPVLTLDRNTSGGISALIALRVELHSFYSSNGRGVHRATWYLENHGAAQFNWNLPAGATLVAAKLDGRALNLSRDRDADRTASISLPQAVARPIVAIEFETQQPRLAAGSKLNAPLGDNDIPILAGEWIVALPAEFAAAGSGSGQTEDGLNWRRLLFGPLGRPNGDRPFHPLRAGDWDALARVVPGWSMESVEGATHPQSLGATPGSTLLQVESATSNAAKSAEPNSQTASNIRHFSSGSQALAGWRIYRTRFVAQGPAAIVVVHPPASAAWGIAVFLICCVGGRWVSTRRGQLFVVIAAAAAGLALWLPEPFAPLATGAFLGLLFSLLLEWPRATPFGETQTKTWHQSFVTAVLAIVALVFARHQAFAEAPTDARPADAAIHRVLIPADHELRPTGTKYFVSERFLRELTRAAQADHTGARQWLLMGASYEGELRARTDPADITAGQWTLTFEVEVLARDTTIVLPIVRDEAQWSDAAALDGIPVRTEWLADGRRCAIQIAEPGRYQLAISCEPNLVQRDGRHRIELSIPRVPGASLLVKHPESLAGIQTPGTLAEQARAAPGQISRILGPADRLAVEWPRFDVPAGSARGLQVTELRWFQVGDGFIDLDVKYVVEGGAGRPESLTVAMDDRWQLSARTPMSVQRLAAPATGRQAVRIPLPPDDIDRQEILLRWRLTDGRTFGQLPLPSTELTSIPVSQRWLAVSSDPALQCDIAGDADATTGTANEFLAKWGEDYRAGQSPTVFTNVAAGAALSLAIKPRPLDTNVEEALHVAAGRDGLRVRYEARVEPNRILQYQFPLSVSENLTIDEITLAQGGRAIPLRWSRPAGNLVNVFYGESAAGEYRLTVNARVEGSQSATYPLPRITSAVVDPATQPVLLYRNDDVLLETRGIADQARLESASPGSAPPRFRGRPVRAYRFDAKAFESARLVVSPNEMQTTVQALTMLTREDDGWWASYSCHVAVEKGELDAARLRVPAAWIGPFELTSDSPATLEVVDADRPTRSLAVRFASPVTAGETVKLQIRGKITTDPTIAVPQITPAFQAQVDSYVLVPKLVDRDTIDWSEDGVRESTLPETLLPPEIVAGDWRSLKQTATPFQVALRPARSARPTASIRLADTVVVGGPAGGRLIITRLVVVSENVPQCVLQVPNNQQLVRVTADGQPALVRSLDARRWQMPLGAAQLPQFIEIVSRSAMSESAGSGPVTLIRPALAVDGKPIPVELSLWSLETVSPQAQIQIDHAAVVPAAEQAALRLDRLVSISEAATSTAADSLLPDGYNWYHRWAARLLAVRDQLQRSASQSGGGPAASLVPSTSEDQLARASQRLDDWLEQCDELLAWVDLEPAIESPAAAGLITDIELQPGAGLVHCVAEGGAPTLTVELLRARATPLQSRIIGLLTIGVVAAAAISLLRQRAAVDFFRRWPHAVLFLFGMTYWAWMWPSWLGLAIAAAAILAALRSGFPGRTIRDEPSTIVRRTL